MFGMGLTAHEKYLVEQEVAVLTAAGMPVKKAREAAKSAVKEAVAQAKASGQYDWGPLGEARLEAYKTDPAQRKLWEAMLATGVTDKDVVGWWNVPAVDRFLMIQDDNRYRLGAFIELLDSGKSEEEAGRAVWRSHAIFGNCLDAPTYADDPSSVPLPTELKLRMHDLRATMAMGGIEKAKAEVERFGTMNGYIRHLLSEGKI